MATKPLPPDSGNFDAAKLYVWIKGVESKVNTLVREVDLLKNDYVQKNGDLKRELKIVNDDVLDLKRTQGQAQQKMDLVIKELRQTAGVEDVAMLKKYVEYWNPLNFVTQRDIERVVNAKLAQLKLEPSNTKTINTPTNSSP